MGLARKRRASESIVDAAPSSSPAPAPAPAATTVEPLGSPAEGREEARERLVGDTMPSPEQPRPEQAPRNTSSESSPDAPPPIPAMSMEDMAAALTSAIDILGQAAGVAATGRKDIQWAMTASEKEAVQRAAVPVCRQYLSDVELSPVGALVLVLAATYVPRYVSALSSAPALSLEPDSATRSSEPAAESPRKESTTPTVAPEKKDYGW